tara:strand:+ start:841 stop:1668 length:828 start_codon:yes stop_codon:yes gene_type:complete
MKYDRILDLMMSAMKDENTWRKTWQSQPGLHQNWISKHIYRGTNQLMTMIASWKYGYTQPYWLTYNQVIDLGGSVKGQKATPAIFFGSGKEKEDEDKTYKFSNLYNIFNIEQTGIELPPIEMRQTKLERPYEIAQALNVEVESAPHHNPSYSPSRDLIRMPMPGQFESDDAHQSTFYHECIHATGHHSRLARDLTGSFGSEDYAKEEFVAELGSVFLCAELGVTYDIQQHASYFNSWQKAIESDPKYLLTAATAAKKASEYCMSQFTLMRKYEAA